MKRGAFLSAGGALLLGGNALTVRALASSSLNGRVRAIAREMPGQIGIYARTFAPGGTLATYHASERFPTASIVKVLIMTTAYYVEERQPGTLSQTIVFHRSDLIGGSDFMSTADDGQQFTIKQLIVPMITVSDNTAANLLISYFGFAEINAVGEKAGMTRTRLARHFLDYSAIAHHNDNQSTPADMGRLLYLIAYGAHEGTSTIVSSQHCTAMLKIMLGQTDRDGIPAALPRHTQVANKTGEVDGTRNDIAVVAPSGENPIVLAIMTKELDNYPAAYTAIHAVTRAVYASASRYSR